MSELKRYEIAFRVSRTDYERVWGENEEEARATFYADYGWHDILWVDVVHPEDEGPDE